MANIIKNFGIFAFFLLVALTATAEIPTIAPAIINIGKVSQPTEAVATLYNKTDKPLVITKIEADCHCTKTIFSRRPIAVSDSSQIKVIYTPASDEGVFYKAVKVYTSASKEPLKFIVRGTNIQ